MSSQPGSGRELETDEAFRPPSGGRSHSARAIHIGAVHRRRMSGIDFAALAREREGRNRAKRARAEDEQSDAVSSLTAMGFERLACEVALAECLARRP